MAIDMKETVYTIHESPARNDCVDWTRQSRYLIHDHREAPSSRRVDAARYERSQEGHCVLHHREMGVGRTTLTHLLRGFLDSKPIYCAVSRSRLSQHLILFLFYNPITAGINEHSESFVMMPSLQTVIKCATGLFAAVSCVRFPRA